MDVYCLCASSRLQRNLLTPSLPQDEDVNSNHHSGMLFSCKLIVGFAAAQKITKQLQLDDDRRRKKIRVLRAFGSMSTQLRHLYDGRDHSSFVCMGPCFESHSPFSLLFTGDEHEESPI